MNLQKRSFLIVALLLSITFSFAQHRCKVSGVVFEDINRNGTFDVGEPVLNGIPISDGDTVIVTDVRGAYRLGVQQGNSLFPILPAGYKLVGSKVLNSNFLYFPFDIKCKSKRVDWAVTKQPVSEIFSANAVGDIQVSNNQELEYASKTIFSELLNTTSRHAINLMLGDVVNNQLALEKTMKSLFEKLPQDSWCLIGNHDRDSDSLFIRQDRTFNSLFGASTYSFNKGNVHFIVLNTVYGTGKRSYEGQISDKQLRFIKNDLKYVPATMQLVLCQHIPLSSVNNTDALLAILKGRGNVLALSGHSHRVYRAFLKGEGVNIHELVAGAACGFWWTGERDWNGVPSALMPCGSPRNYFIIDFSRNDYHFRFKGIGLDANKLMDIWVSGIDSLDTHIPKLKLQPKGMVLATIYGACQNTQVRCRIDGGEWIDCAFMKVPSPDVSRLSFFSRKHIYPTEYNRLNPTRDNHPSSEVFGAMLPQQYHTGTHIIEIEASDKWGFSAFGARTFYFE